MKIYKALLFFCFFGMFPKAHAYLTYLNGRIDRALYDGHDPKTIVAGKISFVHHRETDSSGSKDQLVFWEGPDVLDIDFSIASVIMGDGKLTGQKLNLVTSSFTWPEELVKLEKDVFCILILRDWNWKPDSVDLHIEVVIPSTGREVLITSPPYLRIRDNKSAKEFLENELLLVLDEKLSNENLRATLIQLGPILQKQHVEQIEKFVTSPNKWVRRAALADIVYAAHTEKYVNLLAADVDTYFSVYKDDESIVNEDEYKGYSAFYLYYNFVFFLNPNDRTWGTRWDEQEENLNKQAILKLKATGLLSREVCDKLKIPFKS